MIYINSKYFSRYHIKAIESLMDDLPDNSPALIANLDIILKWLTLRFFDTNPSVLLKGIEYLQAVFNMLIDNQYHMLENEAASFVPYLILKVKALYSKRFIVTNTRNPMNGNSLYSINL